MKAFLWFRKNRAIINGVLITIITSLAFNTISGIQGNLFEDFGIIVFQLFEFHSLSGFITITALFTLLLFNAVFAISRYRFNKKTLSTEFFDFMKEYTSPQLVESVGNGCISWGEGKTVEVCNDILFGWNPENILVEDYEDIQYQFSPDEKMISRFGKKSFYFSEADYLQFMSEGFEEVIRKGNNLPRFMLTGCAKNYDKHNRKLLVSLGRTEWSQTSYIWDRFGKSKGDEVNSNSLMSEYSKGIKSDNKSEPYLPNSFCLHLLIETLDNMVVLSLISASKRNDNPGTWAATLGEQLELEDFLDGNNYYENFVERWVKRAFQEEYKLDENMYCDIVDESSLRCISIDFESDRYNFALFCTIQLRYSFDSFYRKVKVLLSTEEAEKLKPLLVAEIPDILLDYKNEDIRKQYHPSSYLRLLLFYMHKNGYSRAQRKLMDLEAKRRVQNA